MAPPAQKVHQLITASKPVLQASRLLALPAELLEAVLKDAYAHNAPRGPICRSLLPFHDSHVREKFRRVKIRSNELASYCRSLEMRKTVGTMCESFKIAKSFNRGEDLPASKLSLLMSSLPNVHHLVLDGDQLVKTFLEQVATSQDQFMPHLRVLGLEGTATDSGDPYHPSLLKGLANFPALESLTLSLAVPDAPGGLGRIKDEDNYSLACVKTLTLVAVKSSLGAADLVMRCAALSTLTIRDEPYMEKIASVLAAAAGLASITALELAGSGASSWKLPKGLKSLTTVESLVVGRGCTCRDKPSFAILRRLPLTSIEFGQDTIVSASHLLELISGDSRHPTLTELELNNIDAYGGDVQSLDWREQRHELNDWFYEIRLPKWTKTFSRDGLEELVAAAEREGISLTGDAVEAPEIEEQILEDKRQVEGWMEREARRERRRWQGRW